MFSGRKLVIATSHNKEKVIAPILEKELGVFTFLPTEFNSDVLGTFSGEIERKDSPIVTARKKCLLAMEIGNYDLAIASEGSFGPHPSYYFLPADEEFLLLLDKKNNLEIVSRVVSTHTNFSAQTVSNKKDLFDFLEKALFPSHAVILKKSVDDFSEVIKGVNDVETLEKSFEMLVKKNGSVYCETDMRAMHNPSRMEVIREATEKLIDKINSKCPSCQAPGFDVSDAKAGLPCSLCGNPTKSLLSYSYKCQKCSFINEVKFPQNKTTEDPMYCDFCNP
jgi:hypothetical protein